MVEGIIALLRYGGISSFVISSSGHFVMGDMPKTLRECGAVGFARKNLVGQKYGLARRIFAP
jgi:hypothetical protein